MSMARTKKNPAAHRRVYARMFKLANGAAFCIKPSTERELKRWIDSHSEDCAYLSKRMIIRGKLYKKMPRVP